MLTEPPHCDVFTDLRSHPEIAEQVGYYTGAFSAMELMLWHIYGFVLKTDETGAQAALGSIQSFSTKLALIERLFEFRQTTEGADEDAKSFRTIFEKARTVNAFRNMLAHGAYLTDKSNQDLWLRVYLTDPSRKKSPAVHLTRGFMQGKVSEVGRLHNWCLALIRLKRPEIVTTSPKTSP